MTSFHFTAMEMSRNLVFPDGAKGRVKVHEDMGARMLMWGGMVGLTDWASLMLMGTWMKKDMTAAMPMPQIMGNPAHTSGIQRQDMSTKGLGDTSLQLLLRLFDNGAHHLHIHLGTKLPTGSVTKSAGAGHAGYGMQTGSGTVDAIPGLTYTGRLERVFWGAQYKATLPLEDENDEGYRVGNLHWLTLWGGLLLDPAWSMTLRLEGQTQDRIHGRDPKTRGHGHGADPRNYGGETAGAWLGLAWSPPDGFFKGHTLGVESGAPFVQNLHGVQLKTNWSATLAWRKMW